MQQRHREEADAWSRERVAMQAAESRLLFRVQKLEVNTAQDNMITEVASHKVSILCQCVL